MELSPVIQLSRELIQRQSITPDDQGCQKLLAKLLTNAGFNCEHKRFGKVDNLFAWHGNNAGKSLMFLGHTDVVPIGVEQLWKHPPFAAIIEGKYLYGRGAADMKTAVAAFTLAMIDYVKENPKHAGKIALMLTSDEEGEARDGIQKMMPYIASNHRFDYCIVGEPSSCKKLGDVVRIGRRGSLHLDLTIHGKQGHVAYPQNAQNPIFLSAEFIQDLSVMKWDEGNEDFPPTSFQISAVKTSSNTANIIPADLHIQANFRFSPASTQSSLQAQVQQLLHQHQLHYSDTWQLSGQPFHTNNKQLIMLLRDCIKGLTQTNPVFNTAGGTSDGRFVAPFGLDVVELGVINQTIHQVNECVAVTDVEKLQIIYQQLIITLLNNT